LTMMALPLKAMEPMAASSRPVVRVREGVTNRGHASRAGAKQGGI
jgi:hypothetical protein